jgi:hypothetical protein
MTDPEERLAAALHTTDCGCEAWPTISAIHAQMYLDRASAMLAADPTLICPDPEAHARPCTFRPPWEGPCGKPQDDPIHPGPDERKMPGQHVYRSEGR